MGLPHYLLFPVPVGTVNPSDIFQIQWFLGTSFILVTPGHALGFNNWIRKPKNLAVLVAMVLG